MGGQGTWGQANDSIKKSDVLILGKVLSRFNMLKTEPHEV